MEVFSPKCFNTLRIDLTLTICKKKFYSMTKTFDLSYFIAKLNINYPCWNEITKIYSIQSYQHDACFDFSFYNT